MLFQTLCVLNDIVEWNSWILFHGLIPEYIYATLPRTQRGAPIVLGGDPKGKNFLYTNGNSVIIRNIDVSIPVD